MQNDQVTIRKATLADIPLLQQLAETCYMPAYRDIHEEAQNRYIMSGMYATETLTREMTDEGSCYLVLAVDGVPSGYCAFKPVPEEDGDDVVLLDKLYLHPDLKGRGYGRRLFDAVMAELESARPTQEGSSQQSPSQHGPSLMRLVVNRRNAAVDFYKHLGFNVVDSFDRVVGPGYVMDAYVMEKDLR